MEYLSSFLQQFLVIFPRHILASHLHQCRFRRLHFSLRIILRSPLYAQFHQDLLKAARRTLIGDEFTAADFLLSPEAWLLHPRSLDAQGGPVAQPGYVPPTRTPVPIIAAGTSAAQRTLIFAANAVERAAHAYHEEQKKLRNDCYSELKTILTNAGIIGESNARLADNGLASITDSPYTILQRLHNELGVLDGDTEAFL